LAKRITLQKHRLAKYYDKNYRFFSKIIVNSLGIVF